jgi:hypothetical protein
MQLSKLVVLAFTGVAALALVACQDSNSPSGNGNTLRLTSRTMTLSGPETSKSVDASLTCGCSFMMEQMKSWGDTSCIHFNTTDLGTMRGRQSVTATVDPNKATQAHMLACLSFLVNDRMMGTRCMDTITVDYYR